MVQLYLLFIAVTATFVVGDVFQSGCPNEPTNDVMNDEFRNFILDTYNGYRSQLAKGQLRSSSNGTNYPSGKNINKVEWDCELEAISRETSEVCFHHYSANYSVSSFGGASNATIHETPQRQIEIQMQIEFWHSYELRTEGNETRVYIPWEYMMDKVEKIGCWFGPRNCDDKFSYIYQTVVCALSPRLCFYAENGTLECPTDYSVGAPCSVDSDCTNPNGFTSCDAGLGLCTKTPTTPAPTTTTPAPSNPCTTGWFHFAPTNKCYRYVNASASRTQAEAEKWCTNQGKKGHLVSIHDEAENNFVKSLIPTGGDNVLIGYNNEVWTDATPFDFNNFSTTCGNNVCAAFASPTYQWKSVDCNGPFKQFVCKRNL